LELVFWNLCFSSDMRELNDDNLDALLREHYSAELDGQLDRAPAVLARSSRRSPWRAAIYPIALAAGIAAIFLVPALMRRGADPAPAPIAQGTWGDSMEHEIEWNTIDQGTVFVDGDLPMRSIRRQRMDNFRWIDPETNASMQLSVPHSEIVLVGMNAN
jgi:hypothetical protein